MPRIELNGEGEPVWLTPHLRDPQPEGEREIEGIRSFSGWFLSRMVFSRKDVSRVVIFPDETFPGKTS